ncbi:MAG: hypothetical protein ACOX05_00300 [Bacillota bacterium]|jgi:hypothetical protein
MIKKNKLSIVAGLICCLFFLAGCQSQASLADMSPQEYRHESGFQMQLPSDWQVLSENEVSVNFSAEQGAISLLALAEIGSSDYYTPDLLAKNFKSSLIDQVQNMEVIDEPFVSNPKTQYRQLLTGKDDQGKTVYVDFWLIMPIDTVHYYLILIAGGDDYQRYVGVYDDIIASFKLSKSSAEIYAHLEGDYHQKIYEKAMEIEIERLKEKFDISDAKAEQEVENQE